jgi:hypothetical protein
MEKIEELLRSRQAKIFDLRSSNKASKKTANLIKFQENQVRQLEAIKSFNVGDWVQNGKPEPGTITEIRLEPITSALVLYKNSTAPIPECPANLTSIAHKYPIGSSVGYQSQMGEVLGYDRGLIIVMLPNKVKAAICPSELDFESQAERLKTFCSRKPEIKTIAIDLIKRDGDTQQRTGLNPEVVAEYAEAIKAGAKFSPVKVKFDGENYWLYDGFHTTEATWGIGQREIECEVSEGTLREAILESVGVNAEHGLRRTNADKRRAVMTLLHDAEWQIWSNLKIAKQCNVSESFVRKVKGESGIESEKIIYQNKHGLISKMDKQNLSTNGHIAQNDVTEKATKDNIAQNDVMNSSDILQSHSEIVENTLVAPILLTEAAKNDNKKIEIAEKDNKKFEKGDLVYISSNRSDKRLVGYQSSIALITAVNDFSVDLKLWGKILKQVSIEDIKPICGEGQETFEFNLVLNRDKLRFLMDRFDSPSQILDYVLVSQGYQR